MNWQFIEEEAWRPTNTYKDLQYDYLSEKYKMKQ